MPLPKPAPGTLKWWVVGVLGVGAMVGWVVWYGIASTVGAISPQVTGYQVSSDSAVRVDYALIRPAGTPGPALARFERWLATPADQPC